MGWWANSQSEPTLWKPCANLVPTSCHFMPTSCHFMPTSCQPHAKPHANLMLISFKLCAKPHENLVLPCANLIQTSCQTSCQPHAMPTSCHANLTLCHLMPTSCQPQTCQTCQPHANFVWTSCQPCATSCHLQPHATSCQPCANLVPPHANLMPN